MMFLVRNRGIVAKLPTAMAVAFLLLVLAGCGGGGGGGGSAGFGSIIGRVVDTSPTPAPVNNATVACAGLTTTTNSLGAFRLDNVPAGTRAIAVTPPAGSFLKAKTTPQFIIEADLTTNVNDIALEDVPPPPP
jgi:hypothetical protein